MKNTIVLSVLLLSLPPVVSVAQTWDAVGPHGGWINALARDPSGNIYAGTYLGGIFRSSNNGDTWVQIYNDTLIIDALSIATNSGGHIFVGASPGFLRSTNGGVSWQKINNALNNRTVESLVVLANGDILAGNWGGDGVYRSTDNGTTFATINNGLTNTQVRSLAVKSINGYVFAATYGGGVFRSTDGGTSWGAVNNGIPGTSLVNWIGVSPSGDICATGGTTIYQSTNNGDNWTNLAPPSTVYSEIAFGSSAMYAATSNGEQGGVYTSTNGGTTWVQESGLPNKIFTRIIASGNAVVAGSGGLGTWRSNGTSSQGDTWTQIVSGMRNTHIVGIDQAPNGDVYAATLLAGVFRSTDGGVTWFSASSGIPPSDRLSGLAVSPVTGTLFAGGAGSQGYRSTNQGASWTSVSLGGASTVTCNSRGHVFAGIGSFVRRSTNDGGTWTGSDLFPVSAIPDIACNGDTVYAATGVGSGFGTSRGVYRSTDNGSTWAQFNTGLSNLNVTAIEALDTTGSALRDIQCARVSCGTRGNGVFDLNSSGIDWVATGLSTEEITILKVFRRLGAKDSPRAFAGAAALLFTRTPQCAWNLLVGEFKESKIAEVLEPIPGIGEVVLIGTNGRGIQRGVDVISGVEPSAGSPDEFRLLQNYPNPFNPGTRIVYTVKNRELVSLKVYDILGREVATLVNETRDSGEHSVIFDASHLSSGVYFYRLSASDFVQTRKLVVLR